MKPSRLRESLGSKAGSWFLGYFLGFFFIKHSAGIQNLRDERELLTLQILAASRFSSLFPWKEGTNTWKQSKGSILKSSRQAPSPNVGLGWLFKPAGFLAWQILSPGQAGKYTAGFETSNELCLYSNTSFRRDLQFKPKHPGGAEFSPGTQKLALWCSCIYKPPVYLELAVFRSSSDSRWLPIHPLDTKAMGQQVRSLWVRATLLFCLYTTFWVGVRV